LICILAPIFWYLVLGWIWENHIDHDYHRTHFGVILFFAVAPFLLLPFFSPFVLICQLRTKISKYQKFVIGLGVLINIYFFNLFFKYYWVFFLAIFSNA
jgi:hypothetical protein